MKRSFTQQEQQLNSIGRCDDCVVLGNGNTERLVAKKENSNRKKKIIVITAIFSLLVIVTASLFPFEHSNVETAQ